MRRARLKPAARAVRIAFVSFVRKPAVFRSDPSFIYRCENLGLALREMGHDVRFEHCVHANWSARTDIAIFHRPHASLRFEALRRWLSWRGTRLVADVDDLIFDVEQARHSPGNLDGRVRLDEMRARAFAYERALSRFDRLTVSTQPLAEALARRFRNATIHRVPNAVHLDWRRHDDEVAPLARDAPCAIGYTPGTPTHDRDFASIAPALETLLARDPSLRLRITGRLHHRLKAREGQIEQRARVPFTDFVQVVQGVRVNIAPLEESPFNRCKSALKVIEAGYWHIPTVCTEIPDALRFEGAGACFAAGVDGWVDSLQKLLYDEGAHAQICRALRPRTLERADIRAIARQWLDAVTA